MNPSEKEILQTDEGQHFERIYGTKAPDQVSWYRLHLEIWLATSTIRGYDNFRVR